MLLISQNDVQLVRAPIRTFYSPESTWMCTYISMCVSAYAFHNVDTRMCIIIIFINYFDFYTRFFVNDDIMRVIGLLSFFNLKRTKCYEIACLLQILHLFLIEFLL